MHFLPSCLWQWFWYTHWVLHLPLFKLCLCNMFSFFSRLFPAQGMDTATFHNLHQKVRLIVNKKKTASFSQTHYDMSFMLSFKDSGHPDSLLNIPLENFSEPLIICLLLFMSSQKGHHTPKYFRTSWDFVPAARGEVWQSHPALNTKLTLESFLWFFYRGPVSKKTLTSSKAIRCIDPLREATG